MVKYNYFRGNPEYGCAIDFIYFVFFRDRGVMKAKSLLITLFLFLFLTVNVQADNCTLFLEVKSDGNWWNDTYDVKVYFDDNLLPILTNAGTVTAEIHTTTGNHALDFYKAGDSSVHKTKNLQITGNQTYKIRIKSRETYFDVLDESIGETNSTNKLDSAPMTFLQLADPDISEYAKRSVVTSITNYYSEDNHDIFGGLDQDHLHSYSDSSGDPNKYYVRVNDWGNWEQSGNNEWQGENIQLYRASYNFLPKYISATVQCDNAQCSVFNLKDSKGRKLSDSMEIRENSEAFTVPFTLVRSDRVEFATASSSGRQYKFPLMDAIRSVIVAFTNMYADDVFTSDGNSYDTSKFHDFVYRGQYAFNIIKRGTWTYKDNDEWHVDDMYILTGYDFEVKLSCNVSFDGSNFVVNNVRYITGSPKNIDTEDPATTSGWMYMNPSDNNSFLTMPYCLVDDDEEFIVSFESSAPTSTPIPSSLPNTAENAQNDFEATIAALQTQIVEAAVSPTPTPTPTPSMEDVYQATIAALQTQMAEVSSGNN